MDIKMRELDVDEIKKRALLILKYIADICDELNIKYYLLWGTLIGAIRHNGFIPWDDDIDIGVARKDIQKLFEYFQTHDTGNYKIYSSQTKEGYYYTVKRVIDTKTILRGEKRQTNKQCDCGIFVDIYPIEEAGDTFDEAVKFLKKQAYLVMLRDLALKDRFVIAKTSVLYTIVKIPVYWYAKMYGYKYWDKLLENRAESRANKDCKFKCIWTGSSCDSQKDIFRKEVFEDRVLHKFEQYEFFIPVLYDELLNKGYYGDYMKLPPVTERRGHHEYIAFLID